MACAALRPDARARRGNIRIGIARHLYGVLAVFLEQALVDVACFEEIVVAGDLAGDLIERRVAREDSWLRVGSFNQCLNQGGLGGCRHNRDAHAAAVPFRIEVMDDDHWQQDADEREHSALTERLHVGRREKTTEKYGRRSNSTFCSAGNFR